MTSMPPSCTCSASITSDSRSATMAATNASRMSRAKSLKKSWREQTALAQHHQPTDNMLKLLLRSSLLLALCVNVYTAFAAPLERWVYCAQNLWVDKNIEQLEALFQRAATAGYTHVLLTDSKFSKLGD